MIETKTHAPQEIADNTSLDFPVLMYEAWGGQNDYALQLAEALRKQGLDINLVGAEDGMNGIYSGRHWKIIPGYQTPYGRVTKLVKHLSGWIKILNLIKKIKPGVIHFQALRLPWLDWIFFDIIRRLDCKIVFTAHNTKNHEASKFQQWIFDRIYKACDLLFVQTEFSKKVLLQNLDIEANRVRLAPRGTVLWKYEEIAEPTSLRNPRQFWNYNPEDEVVLMFGLIREYKGADLLIKSLAILKDKRPNLKVLIAGHCYQKGLVESYEDLTEKLGLTDRVRFKIERIDDGLVASLFRAADLIALPYKRIDQSAVLVTAYSHQKPVVASATGGFLENIKDEQTGYLFKTESAEDLAKKIETAFSDPEKLREIGQKALRFAQSNYLWKTTAKATLDGYRSIVS